MAEETTKKISEEQAAEQAKRYSERVDENAVADMVANEDHMKSRYFTQDSLRKYWDDACDVFSLLKDRVTGKYTETPWSTIAGLTGALLYVLSPLDLIPDFLPIAGYIDDAAVFAFALGLARDDLARYRAWRAAQKK